MPDVKHDALPAAHAASSRSTSRGFAAGGYTSATTEVDTTSMPASRIRTRSSTACFGRRSAVAVYTTQSGASARSASTSSVALTPVDGRPHSSPASSPTLSGLCTRTPTSSSPGRSMSILSAIRPTLPVLHCATRVGVPPPAPGSALTRVRLPRAARRPGRRRSRERRPGPVPCAVRRSVPWWGPAGRRRAP